MKSDRARLSTGVRHPELLHFPKPDRCLKYLSNGVRSTVYDVDRLLIFFFKMCHLLSEVWWMENIILLLGGEWPVPERGVLVWGRAGDVLYGAEDWLTACPGRSPGLSCCIPNWKQNLPRNWEMLPFKKAGCPLSWGTICQVSGKSHPAWIGLAGCVSVSVHEADKKKSGLWWYLCWRQSRHPFSVNTLKYSIKINCLENTSFLPVDWWTEVSLLKQKKQQRLMSKWIYVNLLRKKLSKNYT